MADIGKRKWRGLLALALAAGAVILWGPAAGLLWLLFFSYLFYGWESRIIAAVALIMLLLCSLFLAAGKDDLGKNIALYVFLLLLMAVVLQIAEYKRQQDTLYNKRIAARLAVKFRKNDEENDFSNQKDR